jgi:hypothetical protein
MCARARTGASSSAILPSGRDLTVAGWPQVIDQLLGAAVGARIVVVGLMRERALADGADAVLPKSQFRGSGATLIRSTWRSARSATGRASSASR